MGSGAILTEVIKAAHMLAAQGVDVTVYSVTRWSELAGDGRDSLRRQLAGDASLDAASIVRAALGHFV